MHMRLDVEPARARIPAAIIRPLENQDIPTLNIIVSPRDPVFGRGMHVLKGRVRQARDGVVGVRGAVVGAAAAGGLRGYERG